jgi:uncharacterized cupin superfamily protein
MPAKLSTGDIVTKLAIFRLDPDAPLQAWPDFPETEISSGARGSNGHRWIDDRTTGLTVGVWEAEANLGRWMEWPVHEFMIILAGEVVTVEADRETVIGPGESFFIPKGRRCIWNQAGYVKKIMVMFDGPPGPSADSVKPIVKIDPNVALGPSSPPSADILDSPVPTQNAHEYFADATGQFTLGVWETTGYHRKLIASPRHELMHLLEGVVSFSDDQGRTQSFKPGETFFVPQGAPNSWKSEGKVRKIYCTLQPRMSG